jgi:glycosyltransferase involved in cell wall biosynthesis
MKFTSIVFLIPTLGVGGAEKNVVMLANYFACKGVRVEVWRCTNPDVLSKDFDPRVKCSSFDVSRMTHSLLPMIRLMRRSSTALFVSNLWPFNLLTWMAFRFSQRSNRLVLVEHIHLSSGLKQVGFVERLAAKGFHFFASLLSTKFVAVSKGVENDLVNKFYVRPHHVKAIYNPVLPLSRLTKAQFVYRLSEPLRILAVGNLKPQKDYMTLLQALSLLVSRGISFECRIAGEGPERPDIEFQIARLRLQSRVALLGSVMDTTDLYRWSDVYVLSSRWEGFGNSLVEALSFGCRVVATDCDSGPREVLVNGKFGVLCSVGDPEAFASGILKSLELSIDCVSLYSHLKQFSVNNVGEEYLKLAQ